MPKQSMHMMQGFHQRFERDIFFPDSLRVDVVQILCGHECSGTDEVGTFNPFVAIRNFFVR